METMKILLIEYNDGSKREYHFDTHKEAIWFVMNEGDHVTHYEIKENQPRK